MSSKPALKILEFASKDGAYKRKASSFRSIVSKSAEEFKPEKGRYHVYVSLACPWAHRVLIYLTTKGLIKDFNPATSTVSKDSIIGLSVVHWSMDDKGWRFPTPKEDECSQATEDHLYGVKRLSELYYKANEFYDGRFTVPVFWDKKTKTIVNNESSEIIRFLNDEFNEFIEDEDKKAINYYPKEHQERINELNDLVYENINNAVYKAGFATKQEVYEKEVLNLFKHLEKVEEILKTNSENGIRYLVSNEITEADVRLFTTIIRFDPVYVQHFKCNIGTIRGNFPNIHNWVRDIYWNNKLIKDTCNFDHIKFHYTKSHVGINPHGITPLGPIPNILPLTK